MSLIAVNEFILDGTDVGARLDSVGTRDDRENISRALAKGREEYAALLARRDVLPMVANDTAPINVLLDSLRARLKFLERRLLERVS